MRTLVEILNGNGVVEEYDRPWGALLIQSAKPNLKNVPWKEYHWRLCVSYQKLNHTTWPFDFTIPRWDDLVQDIYTEENYFIAVDMDSGYWIVVGKEEAHERLALLNLDEKRWQKVIPMVALNAAPTGYKWNGTQYLNNLGWKMLHQKYCWWCVTV